MPWNLNHFGNYNYYNSFDWSRFFLFPLFIPAIIWSLIWKGLALYRAARNGQKVWFGILLVVNTMGILEIVYLLFFSNPKTSKSKK